MSSGGLPSAADVCPSHLSTWLLVNTTDSAHQISTCTPPCRRHTPPQWPSGSSTTWSAARTSSTSRAGRACSERRLCALPWQRVRRLPEQQLRGFNLHPVRGAGMHAGSIARGCSKARHRVRMRGYTSSSPHPEALHTPYALVLNGTWVSQSLDRCFPARNSCCWFLGTPAAVHVLNSCAACVHLAKQWQCSMHVLEPMGRSTLQLHACSEAHDKRCARPASFQSQGRP